MSHFRIEVEVPKGKLEAFMRATVGPWAVNVKEYVDNGEAPPAKNGVTSRGKKVRKDGKRGRLTSRLTMSGKRPTEEHGLLAQGLTIFEKLEASQGVGSITVEVFRNQLVSEGMKYAMQTRLLHEGYLDYLD